MILINVTHITPGKRYIWDKFVEMYKGAMSHRDDIVMHLVSDQEDHVYEALELGWMVDWIDPVSTAWQDDTTRYGREVGRQRALDFGVSHLVWQGIDCLYASRHQFDLLTGVCPNYVKGGLVAARNDSKYPVCRRFNSDGTQNEIPFPQLFSGTEIPAGFPGADCIMLPQWVFKKYELDSPDYVPWHMEGNFQKMCVEEFYCWRLNRDHVPVYCDTRVRPWHVHETGHAGRFYGIDSRIEKLTWK